MGFILLNSGVLFDTPISKFWASSTWIPVYCATIRALKAFLFVFPACKTYKYIQKPVVQERQSVGFSSLKSERERENFLSWETKEIETGLCFH